MISACDTALPSAPSAPSAPPSPARIQRCPRAGRPAGGRGSVRTAVLWKAARVAFPRERGGFFVFFRSATAAVVGPPLLARVDVSERERERERGEKMAQFMRGCQDQVIKMYIRVKYILYLYIYIYKGAGGTEEGINASALLCTDQL